MCFYCRKPQLVPVPRAGGSQTPVTLALDDSVPSPALCTNLLSGVHKWIAKSSENSQAWWYMFLVKETSKCGSQFKAILAYIASSRPSRASIIMRPYLSNQFSKPIKYVLALFTDEKLGLPQTNLCLLTLIPSRVRKPKTSLMGITLRLHLNMHRSCLTEFSLWHYVCSSPQSAN